MAGWTSLSFKRGLPCRIWLRRLLRGLAEAEGRGGKLGFVNEVDLRILRERVADRPGAWDVLAGDHDRIILDDGIGPGILAVGAGERECRRGIAVGGHEAPFGILEFDGDLWAVNGDCVHHRRGKWFR